MYKFYILLILASCSDFSGGGKFAVDSGGTNPPKGPESQNAQQFPPTNGNSIPQNGNGQQINFGDGANNLENPDLIGGSGDRDCVTDSVIDDSATEKKYSTTIVNENCLAGMPSGSAVINRDVEIELLCNLLGYKNVVSTTKGSWDSTEDNTTWTFEKNGVDPDTNLPKGKLKSNPASSVANSWLKYVTCSGKLAEECQFKRNDQGKIDCTGI